MMEMSVEQNSFSLKSVMVNDGTGKHFWVPLCIIWETVVVTFNC